MEYAKLVKKIIKFMETEPQLTNLRKHKPYLLIDFSDIIKFDYELSELLLEESETTISAFKDAIEAIGSDKKPRFKNIKSNSIALKRIRLEHLGKILSVSGTVLNASGVRPKITHVTFECGSCGNIMKIPQFEDKIIHPSRCACGRKGKFTILKKELIDHQKITLEEDVNFREGNETAERINIMLSEDLTNREINNVLCPGEKIIITGVLKDVDKKNMNVKDTIERDIILEASWIEPSEIKYSDLKLEDEDIKKIREVSVRDDLFDMWVDSYCPKIYGNQEIKEAIILQLFGGVTKVDSENNLIERPTIHILLVGDAATGKTILGNFALKIAPKARYFCGSGATSSGIAGTVVQDPFMKTWVAQPGTMVLANGGVVVADELDKLKKEDITSLHESMESCTVTLEKAAKSRMKAETSLLSMANPKGSNFSKYDSLSSQIKFPSTLISRFDLIFVMIDEIHYDDKIADRILDSHRKYKSIKAGSFDVSFMRKYIAYAKTINPILKSKSAEKLKKFYVENRKKKQSRDDGSSDIPITARQLNALVRLSEASARVRLDENINENDVDRAIKLFNYCMESLNPQEVVNSGSILSIDALSMGENNSVKTQKYALRDLLKVCCEESEDGCVWEEEFLKICESKGLKRDRSEDLLSKLKNIGDVLEPRMGKIKYLA